jgi:hypothetical protein
MAITFTIPGVPLINQLDEKTLDGEPDENTRNNCVFASNAALATAYLRKPYWGDQIKDMDPKYGQGYTGGASEVNLVGTMATLGITMTRVQSSTQQGLIQTIHDEVGKGHGVIVTMPSQWNSAPTNPAYQPWNPRRYRGPSHVGLACGIGGTAGDGFIRVMNPWGGFWHDGSDSYWSARLLKGEVWVGTQAIGGSTMAKIVPGGWKDDGKGTLTAPNGVPVIKGFRDYVLSYPGGWEAANWPLAAEQHIAAPMSIEPGNSAIGPGARQDFRWRSLGWTKTRDAYIIWTGQDIRALEQQLATATAQVAQLGAQVEQLKAAPPAAPATPTAPGPIDPKATEALAALNELAKALKVVEN